MRNEELFTADEWYRISHAGDKVENDEFRRDGKKWWPLYGSWHFGKRIFDMENDVDKSITNYQFMKDCSRPRNNLRRSLFTLYQLVSTFAVASGLIYAAETLSQLLE